MPFRGLARRSICTSSGVLAVMVMMMLLLLLVMVIDVGRDVQRRHSGPVNSDCNIIVLAFRPISLVQESLVLPARLGQRHFLRVRSVIALFLHP